MKKTGVFLLILMVIAALLIFLPSCMVRYVDGPGGATIEAEAGAVNLEAEGVRYDEGYGWLLTDVLIDGVFYPRYLTGDPAIVVAHIDCYHGAYRDHFIRHAEAIRGGHYHGFGHTASRGTGHVSNGAGNSGGGHAPYTQPNRGGGNSFSGGGRTSGHSGFGGGGYSRHR